MSNLTLGLRQENISLGLTNSQESTNLGISSQAEATTNLGLTPAPSTSLGLNNTASGSQEASSSVLTDDVSSLLSSASLELRNQNYADLADIVDSISEIYHYGL